MLKRYIALFALAVVMVAGVADATPITSAQGSAYGRQGGTAVTSTTVPVTVMPVRVSGTYRLCNRITATSSVLCGDYNSTFVPSAPSANWEEIPAGQCRSDGLRSSTTLNLPWACVCEASSCAGVMDATWE